MAVCFAYVRVCWPLGRGAWVFPGSSRGRSPGSWSPPPSADPPDLGRLASWTAPWLRVKTCTETHAVVLSRWHETEEHAKGIWTLLLTYYKFTYGPSQAFCFRRHLKRKKNVDKFKRLIPCFTSWKFLFPFYPNTVHEDLFLKFERIAEDI